MITPINTHALRDSLPKGFVARPVTDADVPAIARIVNECAIAETGAPVDSEEQILSDLHMPGIDIATDTWGVFAPDGRLAGYAEFWNINDPKVRPFFFGRVHPDFIDQQIGTHLFRWADERSVSVVEEAPAGVRVSMRVGCNARNTAAKNLFQREGFEHIRSFYRMEITMDAPPPAPVWADGITVRTIDPSYEGLHTAYEANEEAFQDHWGFMPIAFDKWWHMIQTNPEHDPSQWFLAMDGDQIAGTCFCENHPAESPDLGWVNDLAVRRPWRRQGIALALLHHAFGDFYRRGKRTVGLGVDATSLTGATRLYERAGMHVARQSVSYEKELRPGEELSTQMLED